MMRWAVVAILLHMNGVLEFKIVEAPSYKAAIEAIEHQHRCAPSHACWVAPLLGETLP